MNSSVRSRLIGCTILTFVVACFAGASSASAELPGPVTTRVLAILDGAGNGTTGMYLKEVGGPVIAAHAENFQFAPASTIKVLLHLYLHDQVQRGNAAYTDQVKHYPGLPGDCPKDAVADEETEDIIDSARDMMVDSDNPATRANYEHWDPAPATINAYAASIGLNSTAFMNPSGCALGLPNVDGNTATLADYGRLYEGVADSTLLSGTFRDSFYENMNKTNWKLAEMVEAEKPAGMPDDLRQDFLRGILATHKGGSYNVCSGMDCTRWRAWAGWAQLPTCEAGSVSSRSYVWGTFIHNATDSGGPEPPDSPAEIAITAALAEPLREQLHAALEGWGACYPPDVTVTTTPPSAPNGQDGYFNRTDLTAAGGDIDVNVSATDDSGVTALQCTVNGTAVTVGSQSGTNPRTGSFALSADGTHNVVCTATDGMTPANTGASTDADNTVTVKIDATPPTVTCQTPAPVFTWNGPGGTVSAGVSDATSGAVTASISAPAVVTSAGAKTVPLAGEDKAGNSTTADCAYIVAYQFLGFDSPLEVERMKAGSTIPVKFSFGDASGAPMPDADGAALAAACAVRVSFSGGNPSPNCATYNPSADRFEFRLKTAKGTTGMHAIGVQVLDGTVVLNSESTQVFLVR